MSTDGFFAGQLAVAESSGNLRRLPRIGHDGKYAVVDGRRMLNLSSNDYLGIASDPGMPLMRDFLQETAAACQVSGTCPPVPEDMLLGSASSRLLTGTFDVHDAVERMLCRLSCRQAALVFSSGYHMNIGILPAVCDTSTLILADKLVHASIIDGIRLSAGKCVRFRHQDMDQLESLVEKHHRDYSRVVIVTESIFSMDGDTADLKFLAGLKKRYPGVMLYVDEAHAVGVRGETGMGLAQLFYFHYGAPASEHALDSPCAAGPGRYGRPQETSFLQRVETAFSPCIRRASVSFGKPYHPCDGRGQPPGGIPCRRYAERRILSPADKAADSP